MKSSFFCFLFVLSGICGKSQDSTTTLSRFEIFVSQPGSVIKTEMLPLGQAGSYKAVKFTAKNLNSGERMYAVRIDNSSVFNYPPELVNRTALYIDSADLDAFIASAESFLKTSDATQPSLDTRLTYCTPADVQLSCYFATFPGGWGFTINKVFQKLRTPVPDSGLLLNKKRMQQLTDVLKGAK